jgi:regulator of RNase E activity RraA
MKAGHEKAAAMSDPFVERLRRLDACAISDAMDRLGLAGVAGGLPRASGEGRIAGRAITLKVGVGEAGAPRHLGTAAVDGAGPDHVIVVEQSSGVEAGCWGGLLTAGAVKRGVAGVIADGPVRDIDEARALNFPVFAAHFTAKTARGRVVELATNAPVVIKGVTVMAGDFAIADGSGVAFVPAARIEDVLAAAEEIAAREAAIARAIQSGMPMAEAMGANYEGMLKG